MSNYDDLVMIVSYNTEFGKYIFKIPYIMDSKDVDRFVLKPHPKLQMDRCIRIKWVKVDRFETCH